MAAPERESMETLLRRSYYTPEELATLIDMAPYVVREEALQGRLKAIIIDHHVVSIRRQDAIDWLRRVKA